MFGRGTRKVTVSGFADAVTKGIRPDMTHLYLMYQVGGTVIVKWEAPRGDRKKPFRIVADEDGNACPHCAVLLAITRIGDVLPLGDDRVERVRGEYLSVVLREGMLPCPAIGRSPSLSTPMGDIPLMLGVGSWMAECHVGHGDPSTAADCARHRRS
ncbi:hypothetical protein SAMN05660733_00297 [Lentzea albidocapillata]|uniref:Uncharacterized protein n=1 Tax=Lentzea albidocapillata TaxID=40571 RepID=A0A1W1ZXH5_9PSEU|nr:hypothetical protein SAMN05660733_00297 [Lentzea albidocapillata]